MKKILLTTMEFPPAIGGIASYTQKLAGFLGAENCIVLAPSTKTKQEVELGVSNTIIRKPFLFPKFLWPRWLRLFFHTFKIVRNNKIELLLIHHALPVGYVAILIKKILKKPFIVFFHGTDVIVGTKNKWKTRCLGLVIKHAERCIVNSASLKKQLVKSFAKTEPKIEVLYPDIADMFFAPKNDKKIEQLHTQLALEGKKVMLSVGRIDEGKGFTHLTRILPLLLEQIPNLVWLVVGDGPKKSAWWQQVEKAQLQSVVRYIGNVPHTEVVSYYDLANCFALLTHVDENHIEAVGQVFLEAMSRKLPVVAGRTDGVAEIVLHEQTGLLVDVYRGDDAIVQAIKRLLTDTDYAQTLTNTAYTRLTQELSWEKQRSKIEQLFS